MSEVNEQDPIADEACVRLRQGIGRSFELAAEARQKLSELTSDTVYPGPASIILADPSAHLDEPGPKGPLVPPA